MGNKTTRIEHPKEIPSLSSIPILSFHSYQYHGEWTTKKHKLFPLETKEEIFTILLLSLFHPTTSRARHPTTIFYKLPRDMRFEIFKFIATETKSIPKKTKKKTLLSTFTQLFTSKK